MVGQKAHNSQLLSWWDPKRKNLSGVRENKKRREREREMGVF